MPVVLTLVDGDTTTLRYHMQLLPSSSPVDSISTTTAADQNSAPSKRPPRRRRGSELQNSSTNAYAKDLRLWGGSIPCDAQSLLDYIWKNRNKVAPGTLYRRMMAVRHAHLAQGLPSPTADLTAVLKNLHRGFVPDKAMLEGVETPPTSTRKRAVRSAAPITRSILGRMLEPLPRNMLERRDRALIGLMFTGALRRAETVRINIEDLRFTPDALIVKLGETRQIAISITGGDLCGATAVRELIQRAAWDLEGTTGPLFRRADRSGALTEDRLDSSWVSVVVKKMVAAAGLDASKFSAHSLRAGRMAEMARGVR
jgi:integrase